MVKLVHKIQFAENTSSQNLNQVSSEFIINDPTNCGPQWPSVYGKSKWKTFCVIHNDIELISDQFYIFGDHDQHRGNCRASSERPLIGALGSGSRCSPGVTRETPPRASIWFWTSVGEYFVFGCWQPHLVFNVRKNFIFGNKFLHHAASYLTLPSWNVEESRIFSSGIEYLAFYHNHLSGNLLGIGDGFPNTSLVLMEHCLRFHQGWSCNFANGFHFPPKWQFSTQPQQNCNSILGQNMNELLVN